MRGVDHNPASRKSGSPGPGSAWALLLPGLLLPGLLLMVISWQAPALAEESWMVERFEVFVGSPITEYGEDTDLAAAEETEDSTNRPPAAAIEELERALNEVGVWLRENDFPAPAIRPIVQTPSGPAYRVYLCRRGVGGCRGSASTIGTYAGYCADEQNRYRSEYLYLVQENALDSTGVNHQGYQTLVHELMHAILANTPYGFAIAEHCSRNTPWFWISEGIPDAVGNDVREALWAGRYQPNRGAGGVAKDYGARRYDVPLPARKNVDKFGETCEYPDGARTEEAAAAEDETCLAAGYLTSSFWHYVERAHDAGMTYSYLVTRDPDKPGLLDIPPEGAQSWTRDVRWANEGLRNRTGHRLDFLYSLFIADFALRVPPSNAHDRRMAEANTDAEKAAAVATSLRNWLRILFPSGCKEIDLNLQTTHQTVTLTIEPMAATCIWVNEFNLPGLSQISFLAGNDDRTLLEDISVVRAGSSIGVIGGEPVALPDRQYDYYAAWKGFLHDSTERTLYVVTNVARNPGRTVERTFDLVVTLPTMGNSALATVPVPTSRTALPKQEPTFKRRSKTLNQQRSETQDDIARQMKQDKDSLTANVDSAVEVSRSTRERDCVEPFRYDACGPHMLISLNLRPGTWAMPSQTTGAGGQAAQFMGGLQAMSRQIGTDVGQTMENIVARLEGIDGSSVGISFPLIDYGFAGSFDNASINVSMAGGKRLSAIGPADETGRSPLRGQVTIEEYSPFVIRGRFVASLAEWLPNGDDPPIFQPRTTVSGYFSSVAPFQEDERARPVEKSIEEVAEDVAQSFGLSPDVMEMLEDAGAFSGQNSAGDPGQSGEAGGAVDEAPPECDCSCQAEPDATTFCRLVCDLEYEACL